jgi:gamma-polyglutamate biosynthesis protein CapA
MIKIGLLGDVALTNLYDLSKNKHAMELFNGVSEYLNSLDLVIANLESPLTTKENSFTCKAIHLKGDPSSIEILKTLNIGVVSLANNHIFDYGEKGAEDTIDVLNKNNIKHFGYGNSSITVDINKETLNFHGYCCYSANASGYNRQNGVIPLHKKDVEVDLRDSKNGLNILSVHWGDENNNYPRYEFIEFARELTKKNKFILHGHHPHVLQGVESINNSLITYSLGNFCFSDLTSIFSNNIKVIQNDNNKDSLICEITIENNEILNVKMIPIRTLSNGKVVFLEGSEKEDVLKNIEKYSDALMLDINHYIELRNTSYTKNLEINRFGYNWVMSRLNYYFIGAYIKGKLNKKKYSRYFTI